MSNEISRRNLLRFAAIGAGVASVGALGFAPNAQAKEKVRNQCQGSKALPVCLRNFEDPDTVYVEGYPCRNAHEHPRDFLRPEAW